MPTPLGERIRELRKKRNMTLEQLAISVKSSKSYIWELENKNVARPSAEKLLAIANALGTTVEYLLSGDSGNEEDAEDIAFFRKYKNLEPSVKEKLKKMLDLLDDD